MAKTTEKPPDVFLLRSVHQAATAEFTVPAGEYYVGDPCYVLPRPLYDALHDLIFPTTNDVETIHVAVALPGFPNVTRAHIVDIRTCYGDGRYRVDAYRPEVMRPGRGVAVDSGGIAVVDKRLCTRGGYDDAVLRELAAWVTLAEPAVVLVEAHNLTVRGYLTVTTNNTDRDADE